MNNDTKYILQRCHYHINSVNYKVGLRWLFYRLAQEGIYRKDFIDKNGKLVSDYKNKFTGLFSRVRKNFKYGFHPDIIADETRTIKWRGLGRKNERDGIDNLGFKLDKFTNQDYFVLICFEALAMASQFEYYTKHIPLIPFKGDASIPFKWEIAKTIEYGVNTYKKPAIVIYFGDRDDKGEKIFNSAFNDITEWANVDFEVIHGGLTLEDAIRFKLPNKMFDKPNNYQWEALSDEQAREIILNTISKYVNFDNQRLKEQEENEILTRWKTTLTEAYNGN
jgi:hypothetical protein